MVIERSGSRVAAVVGGILVAVLVATPALAGTWQAGYTKYGGVAYTGETGDCSYTYDNAINGGSSPALSYGWSIGSFGCSGVRTRTYYHDANWAGWTSWTTDMAPPLSADSKKVPYGMGTGHQVNN